MCQIIGFKFFPPPLPVGRSKWPSAGMKGDTGGCKETEEETDGEMFKMSANESSVSPLRQSCFVTEGTVTSLTNALIDPKTAF